MPARSAAMLIVFARRRENVATMTKGFGMRFRSAAASPSPRTMPIRAHIICTAAMSGQVRRAVQRRLVPSCAPAMEYVAIPEGSSSAAPVTSPGPSAEKKRRGHLLRVEESAIFPPLFSRLCADDLSNIETPMDSQPPPPITVSVFRAVTCRQLDLRASFPPEHLRHPRLRAAR